MSDRIFERASLELARVVAEINDSVPDRYGVAQAAVPWSRNPLRFRLNQIPDLVRQATNVLLARVFFAENAPLWAVPLPVGDDIPILLKATGSMHLLGLFASSLARGQYNIFAHPSFATFGCGVMAHPGAPGHVRDDSELQREFPAKELPGLCCQMVWHGDSLSPRMRDEILGFGFPPDLRLVIDGGRELAPDN